MCDPTFIMWDLDKPLGVGANPSIMEESASHEALGFEFVGDNVTGLLCLCNVFSLSLFIEKIRIADYSHQRVNCDILSVNSLSVG